ncbi:iron-siderophore ABC transporter substrate-binding protein [Vibrio rhizosphaerae]|uniref:Iron-siderophore ABC transporter substrate-binding protein n=1 Tax=Vibrio rhizosphaerae TaxID=398736 RepID=A0ABU4J000_9VIBR|nr:iron-siderophore ABC transporter substrate-binding protein [Vibrio rhizosphaerae]MDW6094859.1 iron-siderophore ABC transporter substrate-binding protein [Vibrio rhizosphaerae]
MNKIILNCARLLPLCLFASFFSYSGEMTPQSTPRSVTHAMGVTEVPQRAMRVITLFQGATDSAVALGIHPIGVVDAWAEKPTYRYLREPLKEAVHVGLETQPNLETIAALHPDLIIGSTFRHEKIYAQLSQIAPTVFTDNVSDFQQTLALTAQATGRESEGKKRLEQWQHRVTRIRAELQKSVPDWPITASIINVRSDHLRLYLQESFPGMVLSAIGFQLPKIKNAAGWGIKLKSKEALPAINADVFFIIPHADNAAVKQNFESWRHHPLWRILNAPKNNAVYTVERTSWLLSGGILGANQILDQIANRYHLQSAVR